ncbi:hypothetical protein D3C72_1332680 [compost metagenome]
MNGIGIGNQRPQTLQHRLHPRDTSQTRQRQARTGAAQAVDDAKAEGGGEQGAGDEEGDRHQHRARRPGIGGDHDGRDGPVQTHQTMEGGHADHDDIVHPSPHPFGDRQGRLVSAGPFRRGRRARSTILAQPLPVEPGLRRGGADDIERDRLVTLRALHDRAKPKLPSLRVDDIARRATVVKHRRRRSRFSATDLPLQFLRPQRLRERAQENRDEENPPHGGDPIAIHRKALPFTEPGAPFAEARPTRSKTLLQPSS